MSFTACLSYMSEGCSIGPPRPLTSERDRVVEGRLAAVRLSRRRDRLDASDPVLGRILASIVLLDLDVDRTWLVQQHRQVGDRVLHAAGVGDVFQLASAELHRLGAFMRDDDAIKDDPALI